MTDKALFDIDIDISEALELLKVQPENVEKIALQTTRNMVVIGQNFLSKGMRSNKWVKKRSRQLRKQVTNSIKEKGVPNRNNLKGWVGFVDDRAPHAKWLNFGTGIFGPKGQPIIIRVKHAKALSWIGGKKNTRQFAKSTIVRGIKPRNFIKETKQHIDKKFKSEVDALVKKKYG